MILTAGTVHTGDEVFSPGFVEIADGVVVAVGPAEAGASIDLPDAVLAPGLVDVHSHGGGGIAFTEADVDPEAVDRVLALHLSHGTTTMVASLVTASIDRLESQVRALADRVEAGDLAGIHLEGPWLAPEFKGAHDLALLRAPYPADVQRLIDASRHTVKMVTLAPELQDGGPATELMVREGVVVAVGHTNADYDQAMECIKNGATGATHLFNAMPSIHHRAPGPVIALMDSPSVWLEVIADGVHVNGALVAHLFENWPDRMVLVTDAMAAAGAADGDYLLGELEVHVREGVARLAVGGNIAGSTLTMDAAVANCVSWGVPLDVVIRAATSQAADYMSLDVGRLRPGARADMVELSGDGRLRRVMKDGAWVA